MVGRVVIGKETVIVGDSIVKGPSIIGDDCIVGPGAYVGLYTSIADRCHVTAAEIEDAMVMEDTIINIDHRIVRSMIGRHSRIVSANELIPKGDRLIVGENTTLYL